MLNNLLQITQNASEHGTQIDFFLEAAHWFMLVLFVGWTTFFLYTIYRFWQRRSPKADYNGVQNHASSHIEIYVILIEAVLLLGFAFPLWAKQVNKIPPEGENVLKVHAIAYQFGWFFHYPGEDGVLGRKNPIFISGGDPKSQVGLDRSDPFAADDIVTLTVMRAPVNTPVIVDVTSRDVIHNYAVAHMRVSQDAIPGMRVPIWFTPIRTGEFEIICAQLCGAGHYSMKGILNIQTQAEFQAWAESQAPKKPQAVEPEAPADPPTEPEVTPVEAEGSAVAISSTSGS
ncbi:MAG: cytochrome c oxidase subunit II [Verrucomicrobiota bacterium]